ncbi:MAG TPA: hypothetical protein VK673_16665 [Chthoniobacterales bacterium]|nr:hypothetical protein [Chthoniobacterales bacterium]
MNKRQSRRSNAMSLSTVDFWRRGETLGENLEHRGIDRREFMAWCARMAVAHGPRPDGCGGS